MQPNDPRMTAPTPSGGACDIELAARAICKAWGYEWDVPAGHRCDEFTDCPFLCSEDADDKPTKRMCREAAKQAIAPLAAALLAARRGEADAERYRALRAGIGIDLRIVRFGNPPDEDVTHIDGPTGIDAFADELRAALAATPEEK